MEKLQKITVVLPSLDPDEKLKAVIDGLLKTGFTDIILVNDGSKPENLHWFEEMDKHPEVTLLHHAINRGKGAALKTAFTWFLENRPGQIGVVTVDGDNQHHPEDTKACALHMAEHGLLTLGVRDFDMPHVPARSRKGNKITSAVFKIFCGMVISDTQTGLRAIPRKALKILNTVRGDRFEYETNMLLALKENCISFDEVKIRTVYIEENKSSHFRVVRDSWRIYKLILGHFFKYTFSSVLSAVVDLFLVWLITTLCAENMSPVAVTVAAAGGARVLSSLVNFYLNKKIVFHSKAKTGKSMLRYSLLVVVCWLMQTGLDLGIFTLFRIGTDQELLRTLIHGCGMAVLFVINYIIEQRWVFSAESAEKKEGKAAEEK